MTNKLKYIKPISFIALILYSIFAFSPFVYEYIYSERVLNFLFTTPESPILSVPVWLGWLVYALFSVSYLGLFWGYTLARYLLVVSILLDLLLTYVNGVAAFTGMELVISNVLSLLDGALLFILFYKPDQNT